MNRTRDKQKLTIGILGGMGPEATVECFKSIIKHTPTKGDQDHLPILIYNNPQIPDRTEAILHGGEDPVPLLKSSARTLEDAGIDFIIIPCNTAHYFIEEIHEAVDIPVLNMIEETISRIPVASKAGLIATDGTIQTGIYQKYTGGKKEIITPDQRYQKIFMEVIYGKRGVKAGYHDKKLTLKMLKVVDNLIEKGARKIIAGCTEVRLVLKDSDLEGVELITPIDVIAEVAVRRARS